jgi:transposase
VKISNRWRRRGPEHNYGTALELCECLREALLAFGGLPRHVLFDNAKTIVVERDAYGDGQHRWHRNLLSADVYD